MRRGTLNLRAYCGTEIKVSTPPRTEQTGASRIAVFSPLNSMKIRPLRPGNLAAPARPAPARQLPFAVPAIRLGF
jgi:hypothetical protein